MKEARLILVRHGESLYNQENLFTGWSDVELSEHGKEEAREAGSMLAYHRMYPDICYTSWLKRAIHTASLALSALEWEHIDVKRSYNLNERHYGAWQGRNKDEVKDAYGEQKFLAVRRGFDAAPPPLNEGDFRVPWREKKYADVRRELLPLSESLKDTKQRVVAYYKYAIESQLKENKTVLISAHGNSLRALVMHIEKIDKEDVFKLEIPTGDIRVYTFDATVNMRNKEILTK